MQAVATSKVRLKGTAEGLRLRPGQRPWDEVLQALEEHLEASRGFFRGGKVVVELEGRGVEPEALEALRALLEAHGLTLWAVLGGDEATARTVRAHGIRAQVPAEEEETGGAALFLRRTLRSGQRLQFPGDEFRARIDVAGGNVLVWGRVRGLVHAGAFGDRGAMIWALDLNPAQLRIADLIGRPPEQRRGRVRPERAYAEGDRIIVEAWRMRK